MAHSLKDKFRLRGIPSAQICAQITQIHRFFEDTKKIPHIFSVFAQTYENKYVIDFGQSVMQETEFT